MYYLVTLYTMCFSVLFGAEGQIRFTWEKIFSDVQLCIYLLNNVHFLFSVNNDLYIGNKYYHHRSYMRLHHIRLAWIKTYISTKVIKVIFGVIKQSSAICTQIVIIVT